MRRKRMRVRLTKRKDKRFNKKAGKHKLNVAVAPRGGFRV